MNKLNYVAGGSPAYNSDLDYILTTATSGITSAVLQVINPNYFNSNIILWSNDTLGLAYIVSGGTAGTYFQVSRGAVLMGQEVVEVYPQQVVFPYATSLSQLYFNKSDVNDGISVYKNLSSNYNYKRQVVIPNTNTGSAFSTFVTIASVAQPPTRAYQAITMTTGNVYTVSDITSYVDITTAFWSGTSTATVVIPNADATNIGLQLWIDWKITSVAGAPITITVQTVAGTVVETITSSYIWNSSNYLSKWVIQSRGAGWEVVEHFTTSAGNNLTNMPTQATVYNTTQSNTFVSAAALVGQVNACNSTTDSPLGPYDFTSSSFYISGLTDVSTKTIYGVTAVVQASVDSTLSYPLTYGVGGGSGSLCYIGKYWSTGVVYIVINGAGIAGVTAGYLNIMVSHSY